MSRLAFRPASLLALIATCVACAPVAPQVPPDATPSAESASGAPTAPEDAAYASQGGGTPPPEATQPAEAHADNGSGANSGVIALAAEGSNATAADVATAVAVELPLIVAPGSCLDGASIPDRGEDFLSELLAQYPDKFADIGPVIPRENLHRFGLVRSAPILMAVPVFDIIRGARKPSIFIPQAPSRPSVQSPLCVRLSLLRTMAGRSIRRFVSVSEPLPRRKAMRWRSEQVEAPRCAVFSRQR